jgi:hypothetical protein
MLTPITQSLVQPNIPSSSVQKPTVNELSTTAKIIRIAAAILIGSALLVGFGVLSGSSSAVTIALGVIGGLIGLGIAARLISNSNASLKEKAEKIDDATEAIKPKGAAGKVTNTETTKTQNEKPSKTAANTTTDANGNLRADKLGLNVNEYHKALPNIATEKRYAVRDKTLAKVKEVTSEEEMPPNLKEYFQKISLNEFGSPQDSKILGKHSILTTPCIMDFDWNWEPIQGEQTPFYVHHAAATNIGESANAEDFDNFTNQSTNGSGEPYALNEDAYVKEMKSIFSNIMKTAMDKGVKDIVWVPFGMGAFLRNLSKNDASYNDAKKMQALRDKLAKEFVEVVSQAGTNQAKKVKVHLCLPLDASGKDIGTNQNYNAFVGALSKASEDVKKAIELYINVDATDVAQRLSNTVNMPYRVGLVNAANRNLIGNHWYADGAQKAIDENLHRRSFLVSIITSCLNNSFMPKHGENYPKFDLNHLSDKVKQLVELATPAMELVEE